MTVYEFVLPERIAAYGFEAVVATKFGGLTSWNAAGRWQDETERVIVFHVALDQEREAELFNFVADFARGEGEKALYFAKMGLARIYPLDKPKPTPLLELGRQARAVINEWRDAHLDGNLALALAIEQANPDLFDERGPLCESFWDEIDEDIPRRSPPCE